jgi:hypothetical protein
MAAMSENQPGAQPDVPFEASMEGGDLSLDRSLQQNQKAPL